MATYGTKTPKTKLFRFNGNGGIQTPNIPGGGGGGRVNFYVGDTIYAVGPVDLSDKGYPYSAIVAHVMFSDGVTRKIEWPAHSVSLVSSAETSTWSNDPTTYVEYSTPVIMPYGAYGYYGGFPRGGRGHSGHHHDTGAPATQAAPTVSLSVVRNALPQPVVLVIGVVTGIAILLLAYKYKPEWFKFFKPKTS